MRHSRWRRFALLVLFDTANAVSRLAHPGPWRQAACADTVSRRGRRDVAAYIPYDKICVAQTLLLPLALSRHAENPARNDHDVESRERCLMSAVQSNEAEMPAAASYDVVVVGAGFAGLYMRHRLRGLGFTARVYEQVMALAAPGTGTGTRAHAAMSRACSIPIRFRTTCSRSGT